MSFEQWIELVDALLIDLFMMDSSDMEDWGWYDAYASGSTPQEAVDDYREENDLGLDDDDLDMPGTEEDDEDVIGLEGSLFDQDDADFDEADFAEVDFY